MSTAHHRTIWTLATLAALAFALAGCSSDETPSGVGGSGEPPPESFFGDLLGGDKGGSSNSRLASGAEDAATGATAQPCVPGENGEADCPPAPTPSGGTGESDPEPTCPAALSVDSGAFDACKTFCAKVGECLGADAAGISDCEQECGANAAGIQPAAASGILGCFSTADCETVKAWLSGSRGGDDGEGVSSSEPGRAIPDPPPQANPSAPEGDDSPPEPSAPEPAGKADALSDDLDELEDCMEGVGEGFMVAAADAALHDRCVAITTTMEECDDSDVAVSSVSGGGSGQGSSGSSSGSATPSGTPSVPPSTPEGEDSGKADEIGDEEMEKQCNVVTRVLSEEAFARFEECAAKETCDEKEACVEEQSACVPFMRFFGVGRSESSSGSSTVNVSPPSPGAVPEPASTEPEPEPAGEGEGSEGSEGSDEDSAGEEDHGSEGT